MLPTLTDADGWCKIVAVGFCQTIKVGYNLHRNSVILEVSEKTFCTGGCQKRSFFGGEEAVSRY